MDILTLKCFVAIAETHSFTKAALRVHRSQSAVSQQIHKLENIIGKPLIKREKIVSLTPEGEIFLNYARKILSLFLEILDRFKDPDLEGEVRFGVPEDFATVFLSDVLAEFIRIHPRILLHIECDLTLRLFQRFKEREFDLVLVKMSRPEDFPNGQDIWSEKLEWVGNKDMLEALDKPKDLSLVLSPQPCIYRARAINALEKAATKWQLVFSSPSYSGTVAAVKAGLGITVLPKNMIPKELDILHHPRLPFLSDTHISLLKHNPQNLALASFEAFVLEKLRI